MIYTLNVKRGPEYCNMSIYFSILMLWVGDNWSTLQLYILSDVMEYFHSSSHNQLKISVLYNNKNLSDGGYMYTIHWVRFLITLGYYPYPVSCNWYLYTCGCTKCRQQDVLDLQICLLLISQCSILLMFVLTFLAAYKSVGNVLNMEHSVQRILEYKCT